MMKHLQPTNEQYRKAAKRLFPPPDGRTNSVGVHAAVQPVTGEGAYVEMTVWVTITEAETEGEADGE